MLAIRLPRIQACCTKIISKVLITFNEPNNLNIMAFIKSGRSHIWRSKRPALKWRLSRHGSVGRHYEYFCVPKPSISVIMIEVFCSSLTSKLFLPLAHPTCFINKMMAEIFLSCLKIEHRLHNHKHFQKSTRKGEGLCFFHSFANNVLPVPRTYKKGPFGILPPTWKVFRCRKSLPEPSVFQTCNIFKSNLHCFAIAFDFHIENLTSCTTCTTADNLTYQKIQTPTINREASRTPSTVLINKFVLKISLFSLSIYLKQSSPLNEEVPCCCPHKIL